MSNTHVELFQFVSCFQIGLAFFVLQWTSVSVHGQSTESMDEGEGLPFYCKIV